MAKRILVSTRKGLFELGRGRGGWVIKDNHFLADNVTLTLHDPRDGTDYAALNHGHFGIKLHRRDKGKKPGQKLPRPNIRQSLKGWMIRMVGASL